MSKDKQKSELNHIQKKLKSYAEQHLDNYNVIPVSVQLIDLAGGSLAGGLFLTQLIYWQTKTTVQGDWIAKTYTEWYNEIRVEEQTLRRLKAKFVAMGILETKPKKFKSFKTVHYRLKLDELYEKYLTICKPLPSKMEAPEFTECNDL